MWKENPSLQTLVVEKISDTSASRDPIPTCAVAESSIRRNREAVENLKAKNLI